MDKRTHYTLMTTNGHYTPPPKPRWRFALRDIAIFWAAALAVSWLMGLGVVKLLHIIDGILRRG